MNRRETRHREFEDGAKGLSIVDVIVTNTGPNYKEKEVEQYVELDRSQDFEFRARPEFFGFKPSPFHRQVEGRESRFGDRCISILGATARQGMLPLWEAVDKRSRLKEVDISTPSFSGSIDDLREHIRVLGAVLEAAEIMDNDTGKEIQWPDL